MPRCRDNGCNMWLFFLFLAVPLIEIALFIQVGGLIGLWPTLGIVVLTAIAGTYLVRSQGLMAMGQIRNSFEQLDNPAEPLAHGAMILFSGALLLTPGFFTDAVGFSLLFAPVRAGLFRYLKARIKISPMTYGVHSHSPKQDDIIDGSYEEVPPKPRNGPSGWTRD